MSAHSIIPRSVSIRILSAPDDSVAAAWDDTARAFLRTRNMSVDEVKAEGTFTISLINAPDLRNDGWRDTLRCAQMASGGVVLITSPDPESLLELRSVVVDAVVLHNTVEEKLEAAICQISGPYRVRNLIAAAASPHATTCIVAAAARFIGTTDSIPRTETRLARAVDISLKAFLGTWRRHPISRCCTLKQFLCGMRIIRYAELRAIRTSELAAIAEMGISRRTLYVRSRQIFGVTPAKILGSGAAADWIARLIDTAGW